MSLRGILVGWIAIVGATATAGAATPAPTELSTQVKGADLNLLAEVRRVATNVENLRGETFDRRPLAVRVSDEMRQIAGVIRAGNVIPRRQLGARGRAWQDIGLADVSAPQELLELLASDLSGVGFDPDGNRLLVAPDRLTGRDFFPDPEAADDDPATLLLMTGVREDEPVVGHLLMHVRQRERLGRDPLQETTDRLLAGMAWSEGEANLVAVRYLFDNMNISNEILARDLDPGLLLGGNLLPDGLDERQGALGEFLRFVYLEGFARAVEQYREGGWDSLGRAMQLRPTTQALLHPDQPVASNEGLTPPAAPEGMALVDRDTLGEQAICVLVSRLSGKDNLGLLAGDGWNGDRLFRFESEDGAGLTVWRTRWVSKADADDFEYGYLRALRAMYGAPTAEGQGTATFEAGNRLIVLQRSDLAIEVQVGPPGLVRPAVTAAGP